MPRGDKTGPVGGGAGTGGGSGGGRGRGAGGKGRGGIGAGAGPGGNCVCPSCGEKEAHQSGIPCLDQKCPKCGASMTRE
ncbi:MAG: hypothetical protein K9N10_00425 [Deltaproteobacteria bacterium]|nr:hypothetical protein [Deltaproteobacteria bacterium]